MEYKIQLTSLNNYKDIIEFIKINNLLKSFYISRIEELINFYKDDKENYDELSIESLKSLIIFLKEIYWEDERWSITLNDDGIFQIKLIKYDKFILRLKRINCFDCVIIIRYNILKKEETKCLDKSYKNMTMTKFKREYKRRIKFYENEN